MLVWYNGKLVPKIRIISWLGNSTHAYEFIYTPNTYHAFDMCADWV